MNHEIKALLYEITTDKKLVDKILMQEAKEGKVFKDVKFRAILWAPINNKVSNDKNELVKSINAIFQKNGLSNIKINKIVEDKIHKAHPKIDFKPFTIEGILTIKIDNKNIKNISEDLTFQLKSQWKRASLYLKDPEIKKYVSSYNKEKSRPNGKSYTEQLIQAVGKEVTSFMISWINSESESMNAKRKKLNQFLPTLLKLKSKYPKILKPVEDIKLYRGIALPIGQIKKYNWAKSGNKMVTEYTYSDYDYLTSYTDSAARAFEYTDLQTNFSKKGWAPVILQTVSNDKQFIFNHKFLGQIAEENSDFGDDAETIKIDNKGTCKMYLNNSFYDKIFNPDYQFQNEVNRLIKSQEELSFVEVREVLDLKNEELSQELWKLREKFENKFEKQFKISDEDLNVHIKLLSTKKQKSIIKIKDLVLKELNKFLVQNDVGFKLKKGIKNQKALILIK